MIDRGKRYRFTLERLNLTSLGSPANTRVVARLEPRSGRGISEVIDRSPVDDSGTAKIDLRMPRKVHNRYVVRLVAQPSRTTVVIPVRNRLIPRQSFIGVPGPIKAGETSPRLRIAYADPRGTVRGKVPVRAGGEVYTRRLVDEKVRFVLEPFDTAGRKKIKIRYLGSLRFRPHGGHVVVRVVR